MNGCTETDKPLISIVMAVYEPNLQWFREQLDSLEAQTYPNLELLVIDDCSPTVPFETIRQYIAQSIRSFPYQVARNEKNLGSNGTFEKLTLQAHGKYIAYCDQDDIWFPQKLSTLQKEIEKPDIKMVCSDMHIIDGRGNQIADSITNVRKHHVFLSGSNLGKRLIVSNFVTGCTMMVYAEEARKAIPFCPYMVHDHYLALYVAMQGKIVSISDPLIKYRIHGNNQTTMMAGVEDKESYFQSRIITMLRRVNWLQSRMNINPDLGNYLEDVKRWMIARKKNFEGISWKAKRIIWKYRYFSPLTSIFEIIMAQAPEWCFMLIINLKKKNLI